MNLGATWEFIFLPVVTLQHPFSKNIDIHKGKGVPEFVYDEKNRNHKCNCCGDCIKFCPSDCIDINKVKKPESEEEHLLKFIINFSDCSLCGLCIDNCKQNALIHSDGYGMIFTSENQFTIDLLKRFKEKDD